MTAKKINIGGVKIEVKRPAMRNGVHILWVRFTPTQLDSKLEKIYHAKLKNEGLNPKSYGWGTFVRDLAMAQAELILGGGDAG